MKKLILLGVIGAVAVVACAKSTGAWSYVRTSIAQVKSDVQGQIPVKFELNRIREELKDMDADIAQMVRPIAEYKVAIERMRKDITRNQTRIDEQKKVLLGVADELKGNQKTISIGGTTYPVSRVQKQLVQDTDKLKQLEKFVATQRQVLESKEASLTATQDQLAKLVSKKREYEVRVAQLEAEQEALTTIKIGSDIKIDSSTATRIENALNDLEHRLRVEAEVAAQRTGEVGVINLNEREQRPTDLQAIRDYLNGNTPPADKTASNR
jgi:peptidoglycan hydrolase CwlO-like protein